MLQAAADTVSMAEKEGLLSPEGQDRVSPALSESPTPIAGEALPVSPPERGSRGPPRGVDALLWEEDGEEDPWAPEVAGLMASHTEPQTAPSIVSLEADGSVEPLSDGWSFPNEVTPRTAAGFGTQRTQP